MPRHRGPLVDDSLSESAMRDLYASREALDEGAGCMDGVGKTCDQLEAMLAVSTSA